MSLFSMSDENGPISWCGNCVWDMIVFHKIVLEGTHSEAGMNAAQSERETVSICVHQKMMIPFNHYVKKLPVMGWLWLENELLPRVLCYISDIALTAITMTKAAKALPGNNFRAIPHDQIDWDRLHNERKAEIDQIQFEVGAKYLWQHVIPIFEKEYPTGLLNGLKDIDLLAVRKGDTDVPLESRRATTVLQVSKKDMVPQTKSKKSKSIPSIQELQNRFHSEMKLSTSFFFLTLTKTVRTVTNVFSITNIHLFYNSDVLLFVI
jgi:hypothetical protein